MKVIRGLIMKDLLQLKNYKRTLIMFLIIFVLVAVTQENLVQARSVLIAMLTLGFGMFAMASFNYDELAKADKYVLTFPITKKEVVRAKYLLVIFATVIGSVIGTLLTLCIAIIFNQGIANLGEILMIALGSIFGISLVEALQIPCIMKSGAEKGRIQMFILVILVALGLGGIVSLLSNLGILSGGLGFLGLLEVWIPVILFMAICVMYAISYKISCHIYEKKEL